MENRWLFTASGKLNNAQRNYTTGKQELLSIVETLKEFQKHLTWTKDYSTQRS
jgi:hypothetical protein